MAQTLREKVIKAAVAYIAESGPDGLSFRQIAADAGVSHQAPYHHFGDRGAIFTEIAREGFRKFTQLMSAPAARGEDTDLAVRLCERYVDFATKNKGYFRVMFRSDLCHLDESTETQKVADEAFDTLLRAVKRFSATTRRSTKFAFRPLRCGPWRTAWQRCSSMGHSSTPSARSAIVERWCAQWHTA